MVFCLLAFLSLVSADYVTYYKHPTSSNCDYTISTIAYEPAGVCQNSASDGAASLSGYTSYKIVCTEVFSASFHYYQGANCEGTPFVQAFSGCTTRGPSSSDSFGYCAFSTATIPEPAWLPGVWKTTHSTPTCEVGTEIVLWQDIDLSRYNNLAYSVTMCVPGGYQTWTYTDSNFNTLASVSAVLPLNSGCKNGVYTACYNSLGTASAPCTGASCVTPTVPPYCAANAAASAAAVTSDLTSATSPTSCFSGTVQLDRNELFGGGGSRDTDLEVDQERTYPQNDGIYCIALTAELNYDRAMGPPNKDTPIIPRDATVRIYSSSSNLLLLRAAGPFYYKNMRDYTVCTSNNCNSPFEDACALPDSGYTSRACGGGAFTTPAPSTDDIQCYSTDLATGEVSLQPAAQDNRFCLSFTTVCGSTDLNAAICDTLGVPIGAALRLHGSWSDFSQVLNAGPDPSYYLRLETYASPVFYLRAQASDIVLCNTEGCNAPSTE